MKDLIALKFLTPFLEPGRKFRIPAGQTYDDVRQSKEIFLNLNHWVSQAREHWKEHRPTYYRDLTRAGKLGEALKEAAEATHAEMSELEAAGYSNQEAWEMVRETYLFPPGEPEKDEVVSKGAALFNEANAIQSEILRMQREDQIS